MHIPPMQLTSQQALDRLVDGNRRYTAMRQLHPHQSALHRATLVDGQYPFAAIFSCSDSRVPSEIVFDQGLGDLFIVRLAGHAVSDLAIASLEFAVYKLAVPLIVVLGHSQCGAVAGALADTQLPGGIGDLVSTIQPAVRQAHQMEGELLENAIKANSRLTVQILTDQSELLARAVAEDRLLIVPAYYSLDTGEISLLD